jgi:hypothetical protein
MEGIPVLANKGISVKKTLTAVLLALCLPSLAAANECEASYDPASGDVVIPCLRIAASAALENVQLKSLGGLDYRVSHWQEAAIYPASVNISAVKVFTSPVVYAQIPVSHSVCVGLKSVTQQAANDQVIDISVVVDIPGGFALSCSLFRDVTLVNVGINIFSAVKDSYQLRINGQLGPRFDWSPAPD